MPEYYSKISIALAYFSIIFLFERGGDTVTKTFPMCWFTPKKLTAARARVGLVPKPGARKTQSRPVACVAGTLMWDTSILLIRLNGCFPHTSAESCLLIKYCTLPVLQRWGTPF